MSTELTTLPESANAFSLTRFMPRDLPELVRFSEYAAKSGVYGAITPGQALIVMLQGAELGINPLQALREIPLVNGKPRPSATLVAGLIQKSPLCEDWHIVSSPQQATIHAKRKGRGSEFVVTIRIEDVPASLTSKQVWKDNPEDMLVARAIHRMARRAFADILAGIQDPDEIDETRVIDVAKVERVIGNDGPYDQPHRVNRDDDETPCAGSVWLHANRTGGAFLACDSCTATFSPPQAVRDAIRGTPEHLTIAGASEPVLEPGERLVESEPVVLDHQTLPVPENLSLKQTVTREDYERVGIDPRGRFDAPESAVQSEYESATIDGEDVVAVAVSEASPIPELHGDDPKAQSLAIRSAVYQHWILPRPTDNKIVMRRILEDFGWTTGETLQDWMLDLPLDKLTAINDAMAQFR